MAGSSCFVRQQIVEKQTFGEVEAVLETDKALASPQLYDVFINHRGTDVKRTLAYLLYSRLQKKPCRAFLDLKEMQAGDSISSTIQNAIKSSSVQIAIFSKGYAESKWCLDELVLMLQQTKALFIPVFYDVEPWELRYIEEKGAYAKAFSEYERKERNLNKLEEWKSALHSASEKSGYIRSRYENYYDFCDAIMMAVEKEVKKRRPIHVVENPVGLSECMQYFQTHCFNSRLEENFTGKTAGIYGLGGSGKTTLATALFNLYRTHYNTSCFLFDVREVFDKGELHSLQSKLLNDLFAEDTNILDSKHERRAHLSNRLKSGSGLLIVLDDIDRHEQFEELCFKDMQGAGNLVVVTTRDQRVLTCAGITARYQMRLLEMPHSKELFCRHAFHQPYPDNGYEDLVEDFVKICAGLPLYLKVLGSHVYGSPIEYWRLAFEKARKTPPEEIIERLKISLDRLDFEEKQIFIDIACFFIDKRKDMAVRIWKGSGWTAEHALQILRDKCLVEVKMESSSSDSNWEDQFVFKMHDHLRDLGRHMADKISPPRLWQSQDLRSMESKGFEKIVAERDGTRCFHSFRDSTLGCKITFFKGNTHDLLWLELELDPQSKFTKIPSWIPLQKLQGLYVHGPLEGLWNPNLQSKGRGKTKRSSHTQANFQLEELKKLVLINHTSLPKLPILTGQLTHLECLVMTQNPSKARAMGDAVTEGTSLSRSLTKLSNLRSLFLSYVSSSGELILSNTEDSSCMKSLQTIDIECENLSKLLISRETCPHLRSLICRDLAVEDLELVTTLNHFFLCFCIKLKTISWLSDLDELVTLAIDECWELEKLPNLAHLRCLESISISGPHKLQSIVGIEELQGLKFLVFSGTKGSEVWNSIYALERLPLEVTTVMCADAAESSLNANLFCDLVDADSVNELH
ncbi:hypothetical protein KI387_033279, partial [Taxus chinensis]